MTSPKRYRIEIERSGCIGVASCTSMAPDFWAIDTENKAYILSEHEPQQKGDILFAEISAEELDMLFNSARVCPVNVIHIYNLATGEKLI